MYHKKYTGQCDSLYYRCTRTKPCAVPFGPQRLCILLQKDSFPSLSRLSFFHMISIARLSLEAKYLALHSQVTLKLQTPQR